MRRSGWRVALSALVGFAAGVAMWTALLPLYTRAVAKGTELVLRTFERPAVTQLRPSGETVVVNREDFHPQSPRPTVPLGPLTFNVALLTTLFALSPRILSDRNVGGFFVAALLLFLTHVAGFTAEVMSLYVTKLGPWSAAHYGETARTIWSVAAHANRLVLMHAFAFAFWWMFRDAKR